MFITRRTIKCNSCKKDILTGQYAYFKDYFKLICINCFYTNKKIKKQKRKTKNKIIKNKPLTTGKIGENIFINFLTKNQINYIDLRNSVIKIKKTVYVNGAKTSYVAKTRSHPFDFIVNDKNIEIKTSEITNTKKVVSFNWAANNIKIIDAVICIVVDCNKKFIRFYIFDKKYIRKNKLVSFIPRSEELKNNNKKELLNFLINK